MPKNLLENLMDDYNDCFKRDGNLIPEKYEAFVHFVDQILTSVSSRVNNYTLKVHKAVELSNVFTVSNEAFTLITLENYYNCWVRMLKAERQDG